MIDGKLQELVDGLFEHFKNHGERFMSSNFIKKQYQTILVSDLLYLEGKGIVKLQNKGKCGRHPLNCLGIRLTANAYSNKKEGKELFDTRIGVEGPIIYIETNNGNVSGINNGQQIITKNNKSKFEKLGIIGTLFMAFIKIYEFITKA